MGRLFFWLCVIAIVIYATQNNWFGSISSFFNNIKGDIEYQKNYVPEAHNEINDGGVLTIEENESKVVRRSALGTVHRGGR